MKQPTCEERIEARMDSRLDDLRAIRDCDDYDNGPEDIGPLHEYGLSLDYVEPDDDNPEGFVRYLLAWGGPSCEFRFYVGWDGAPYRVDFWFMDWFDGASRTLSGDDRALLLDIWEMGYFESVLPARSHEG